MPRRSRITVAEVPVNIIQRGNNRGACFFTDRDYELCLALLQAMAATFDCAVHAYCLMTNASGGFAFLESSHDVFIDLRRELLEVEQHEHGRAYTLNLVNQ